MESIRFDGRPDAGAGEGTGPRAGSWPAGLRLIVSLAILFHLAAVVAAPLAGPPPATLLANRLIQPLRPYIGLLYLGHGYRFFAPDPGPGHSIEYRVTRRTGDVIEGRLPDPSRDRPRLLYHRRFMVSEKIAALVPPADAPPEIRLQSKREWGPLVLGVARQLLREQDGVEVTLTLVEHPLPGPDDILEGRIEPDLETPLGTYAVAGSTPPGRGEAPRGKAP
jgi:hypothetical protein